MHIFVSCTNCEQCLIQGTNDTMDSVAMTNIALEVPNVSHN